MSQSTRARSGRGLGPALVVGALLLGGTSAGAATLRWKFAKGEAIHYRMDQKSVVVMKPAGTEIKTTVTQTIDSTWTVDSVASDGSATVSMAFDRIRNKVDSSLVKFEYDSDSKKEPEGPGAEMMVKTYKALVGVVFKFKINTRGEISEVRVPQGLLDALKASDPGGAQGQMFTDEGWKTMIKESSLALPSGDLAPGKTWTSQGTVPLGPGASIVMDKTYTYKGTEAKSDRIALDVKMTLDAPANPGLDLKLVDPVAKGTFLFDNDKGRVVSSEVTQKVALKVKVNGMEDVRSTETANVMTLVEGKAGK